MDLIIYAEALSHRCKDTNFRAHVIVDDNLCIKTYKQTLHSCTQSSIYYTVSILLCYKFLLLWLQTSLSAGM